MEQTFYSIHDYYISHHGIKGQRWGVRRFRNPDGTLTEEGRKRYGYDKPMTKRQQKYADKLVKLGMNADEAEFRARQRTQTLKKWAIGLGAVTVAALAIQGASRYRKYARETMDRVIKSGMTVQNLSADKNRFEKGTAVYAAYKKRDKEVYKGLHAEISPLMDNSPLKSNIERTAKEDVKIASTKSAKKVFDKLMKNEDFKKDFDATKQLRDYAEIGHPETKEGSKKAYEMFNRWNLLDDKNVQSTRMQKQFYDALRKEGYGGVVDVNDRKYSGFDTDAVILFAREKFGNEKVASLSRSVVETNKTKYVKQLTRKQILNAMNKPTNNLTAISIGLGLSVQPLSYQLRKDQKDAINEKKKNARKNK